MIEETDRIVLTDRLTYIFIELPKFVKSAEELDGDILEGMYFCLKNMPKLQERPNALKHGVFDTIFEMGELLEMDEVTRDKILENMTTERDLKNQFEYVKKEGRAEGRAEGALLQNKENAMKMKAMGLPIEVICQVAGLTEEEDDSIPMQD